jgi:hypothetical protein
MGHSALRRQSRPGYQIARDTGLSAATVSRILRRARLSRWRDLHPRPPVVRYEHPHPGDLLHLNIKGLPQYQQVSMRGDGRRRGTRHPGRKALHFAVDDHSRLAFYAQYGITVRALLTDMVVSLTLRPSAKPPLWEQRLDHLQPPANSVPKMCRDRLQYSRTDYSAAADDRISCCTMNAACKSRHAGSHSFSVVALPHLPPT